MASENGPLIVPVGRGRDFLSFAPAFTGWAVFVSPHYTPSKDKTSPGRNVFVRFGRVDWGERPKIAVCELYVAFSATVGPRAARDLPLARLEAAVNQPSYYEDVLRRLPSANAVMSPFPWDGPIDWWFAEPPKRRAPRLQLRIPEGQPKPDSFYEAVAERFSYLATVSKRPATDLAEANGVPATQVHSWVKEARRRGLLPPGERARRGEQRTKGREKR